MNVFLACASEIAPEHGPAATFKHIAEIDRFRKHSLTTDVDAADIILFADSHLVRGHALRALTGHDLVSKYPKKCMTYDERDNPWCALPGIYVSMPREWFDKGAQRAWGYYTLNLNTAGDPTATTDTLYSFVGSLGAQVSKGREVRTRILSLIDDRSYIQDTSGFVFYDDKGDPEAHRVQQRSFAKTLERSKFILCPRGAGTSSIRTFEALRSGRVPVIISDEWVAPIGPDWSSFSVTIREADVDQIPEILRSREPEWENMSMLARNAFTEWFAPDVSFHHMVEQYEELLINGAQINRSLSHTRLAQIESDVRKQKIRNVIRKLLGGIRR